jgi:hypothetical protein
MVRQRHVTRHWHVAPADQPRIRDGVMGGRHGRVVTMLGISPRLSGVTPQDTAKTPS